MAATGGTSGDDRGRIASYTEVIGHDSSSITTRMHRHLVVVTAIVGLAFVASRLAASAGLRPEVVVIAIGLAPLVGAARVDLATGRLPDGLLIPAGLVALTAVVDPLVDASGVDVVSGAVLGAGPLLALHLISPTALGFGDVKAAAAGGALIGLIDPLAMPIVLGIAAALTAIAAIIRRRRSLPFGPGLVAGLVLAVGVYGTGGR